MPRVAAGSPACSPSTALPKTMTALDALRAASAPARRVACKRFRHIEYFFDQSRIERMLFDGAAEPVNGDLEPDLSGPASDCCVREPSATRSRR